MKRLFAVILVLVMTFNLTACNVSVSNGSDGSFM